MKAQCRNIGWSEIITRKQKKGWQWLKTVCKFERRRKMIEDSMKIWTAQKLRRKTAGKIEKKLKFNTAKNVCKKFHRKKLFGMRSCLGKMEVIVWNAKSRRKIGKKVGKCERRGVNWCINLDERRKLSRKTAGRIRGGLREKTRRKKAENFERGQAGKWYKIGWLTTFSRKNSGGKKGQLWRDVLITRV